MKKRYTLLLSALIICMSAFFGLVEASAATDEHWASQYLDNLVDLGIMRGDENGELNPDRNITRAEFVALMNRAFGYKETGKISFRDVDKEAWYYDDICVAKNRGYFNGKTATTAAPTDSLKREEAVAMLCRALKIEEVDFDALAFTDSKTFSAYSKKYITAAVEKEFLNGYADGSFKPSKYMTRGEMAKVLSVVAGEIVNESGENYIGYANGNVSMIQTGANLRNTIIPGDLYITAGMGSGYTHLKNITVGGDLIISGIGNAESGEISVVLEDCDINHLVVNSGGEEIMSIRAEGGSIIDKTTVRSNTYLEEANSKGIAFKDVVLDGPAKTALSLAGSFEDVKVLAENNKLSLDKGTIESLTVDEDAVKGSVFLEKDTTVYAFFCDTATNVTGTGNIEQIVINANGCNIAMRPDYIYIRPGITAIINGEKMGHLDGELNNADPEFMNGYPRYMDLQPKSVKLLAKVNKPGTVYWAVKNIDVVTAGMSEDDVISPDKRYVVKSGKVSVVGEKEVTINVSGLHSGVNYEYYMIFVDLKGERTIVEEEEFITVDNIVPKFLNGTPRIQSVTNKSFNMLAMPSEDVSIYWAVLPNKAVPPTAESLAELKVSGALGKGEVAGALKNEPINIIMEGELGKELQELVQYDIYMVMRDQNGNLSKLYKIKGKTGDATDPEFMAGYPWAEPSDATALKIRHMVSEAGTLYWAVYDFDAEFPPVSGDGLATGAGLTMEELEIRAVTTGQKAIKSGKTSVKEQKDALLRISGLTKATPYDVYFVIMDKSGNYSDVVCLKGVKTKDTWPPKGTMVFDKVIEGIPTVESKVMIEFDEIVYYDDETDLRLAKLDNNKLWVDGDKAFIMSKGTGNTDDERLASGRVAILKEVFSLHDKEALVKPDYYNDIDFNEVKVTENNGKTIVIFPPSAFGKDKSGLNSGGTYQFELNNLTDYDGNAIDVATLLSKFSIAPPQMYISDYTGDIYLQDNQIAFTLTPTGKVNNNKLFDVIVKANRAINFNVTVYKEDADGVETKLGAITASEGAVQIVKDQAASLGRGSGEKFYVFEKMQDKLHLVFDIVEMDGLTNMKSWHDALVFECMGVIGGTEQNKSDIRNLGIALNNNDFKGDAFDYVRKYDAVLIVTNPETHSAKRVYTDTAQPVPVKMMFETFDTASRLHLMLDKPAKVHYVVLPSAKTVTENGGANVSGSALYNKKYDDPTKGQVVQGKPVYGTESKNGTIEVREAYIEVEELFEGLKPDTTYRMFYVIEGNDLPGAELKFKDFTTEPEAVPVLVADGQLMPNDLLTEKSVGMQGTANTEVVVRWIMQPAANVPQDKDGYKGYQLNQEIGSPYTPEQIFNLSDKNNDITDYGTFEVVMDENGKYSFEFECENMEHTQLYNVYLAMQTTYSGKISDYVYIYKGIRSRDTEPPQIVKCDTSSRLSKSESTTVGGIEMVTNYYNGSVLVEFSEPLYRSNSASAGSPGPLKSEELFSSNGSVATAGALDVGSDVAEITNGVAYTAKDDETGVSVVNGFRFNFKDMTPGASVTITGYIYDKGTRIAGTFKMTFREEFILNENGVQQANGVFDAEFIPVTNK